MERELEEEEEPACVFLLVSCAKTFVPQVVVGALSRTQCAAVSSDGRLLTWRLGKTGRGRSAGDESSEWVEAFDCL